MTDVPAPENGKTDEFLQELESAVRKILRNNKVSKADKLSAINAGVRLAAIKHKVASGGGEEEGFFGK